MRHQNGLCLGSEGCSNTQGGAISILVKVSEQRLYLRDDQGRTVVEYPVSTSRFGTGNRLGSYQTPIGTHRIYRKIGDDCQADEVFVGREPQGRLSDFIECGQVPDDPITARILWLEGLEPGINEGGEVDSCRRYIYIHGTGEEELIGRPASKGCIRMYNKDVIDLFERVDEGCLVIMEQ